MGAVTFQICPMVNSPEQGTDKIKKYLEEALKEKPLPAPQKKKEDAEFTFIVDKNSSELITNSVTNFIDKSSKLIFLKKK